MKLSADLVCLTSSFVVDKYDVMINRSFYYIYIYKLDLLGSIALSVLRKRIPIPNTHIFLYCNFWLRMQQPQ